MAHVPHLITDLALILFAAGVVSLLFKKLNQPVVLGYIIAGLLVSPNYSLFPTVTEVDSIKIWAEIGVIFLLFSLGLEFSFKKLVKVGSTAAITGLFEVTAMLITGYFAGQLLGWGKMDSIFLGGIIAISSTTIIFRAFDELGLKAKKFTGTVIGILVIEDLAAVLLMVLLSTLAVSQKFQGGEMLASVFKLGFFLVLWFLMGIYLLPGLLKKLSKHISDETLLIISIALCLGMVLFAANVGFSAALGAFIMGSILAETTQAERIVQVLKSVKDLFGAVFFVSVGMLINPGILITYIVPVILLTFIVMLGKTFFVTSGALISGVPLKQSVQAGTSLSQIGEFSFIIATLGLTLGVTSDFLYPIAVGVSVITTFTTPYMIRFAEPLHGFLNRVLPTKWLQIINDYSTGAQHINS
jgi:CPA2 family monovalent cation:H+ antiporter-2